MRFAAGVMVVVAAVTTCQCTSVGEKPKKDIDLFDGKGLDGWEHYLVKTEVKMEDVWSVRDGLLVCKGVPMGYLATKQTFTDFHLVVEWRWPSGTKPTNSGVLLRITGEPRALPKCMEAQLKHESAGDLIAFHGFTLKGDAARSISKQGERVGKLSKVSKVKFNEKNPGEWNRYEITVEGGNVVYSIFDMAQDTPVEYRDSMNESGFKDQFSWKPNDKDSIKWTWHDKTPFPWERIMGDFPSGAKFPSVRAALNAAQRVAESLHLRAGKIRDRDVPESRQKSVGEMIDGIAEAVKKLVT